MRKKTVALYDPYLDIMGGGEKYVLSILKVLEDKGYEINVFWSKDLTKDISYKFDLQFNKLNFLPNIFPYQPFYKKYQSLKKFDIFIYVSDGSYFFSGAKNNYIYAMIPQQNLYPNTLFDRLKTFNYKFITHSKFNFNNLKKWRLSSQIIYPYLNDSFLKCDFTTLNKEKLILSVGRFYKHLHAKRQDIMIKSFKEVKQKNNLFKDYKLILTGGLLEEDKPYLNELTKLIKNDSSIQIIPNPSFSELFSLYQKSSFFWHFSGYGIDETKNPEQVEHLGIAPLEAMATGSIVFAYNAGGPKELIQDRYNGFLFNNIDSIANIMIKLINNNQLANKIRKNAKTYIVEKFNYDVFKNKVMKIFL